MLLGIEFDNLVHADRVVAFIVGLVAAWGWTRAKEWYWKFKHPNDPCPKPRRWKTLWVAVSVAAILMVSVMWQTQATGEEQRRLALQTQELAESACEEGHMAKLDRAALGALFLSVIAPPLEIAKLPDGDPGKTKWFTDLINGYVTELQDTNEQRTHLAQPGVVLPDCEVKG